MGITSQLREFCETRTYETGYCMISPDLQSDPYYSKRDDQNTLGGDKEAIKRLYVDIPNQKIPPLPVK